MSTMCTVAFVYVLDFAFESIVSIRFLFFVCSKTVVVFDLSGAHLSVINLSLSSEDVFLASST